MFCRLQFRLGRTRFHLPRRFFRFHSALHPVQKLFRLRQHLLVVGHLGLSFRLFFLPDLFHLAGQLIRLDPGLFGRHQGVHRLVILDPQLVVLLFQSLQLFQGQFLVPAGRFIQLLSERLAFIPQSFDFLGRQTATSSFRRLPSCKLRVWFSRQRQDTSCRILSSFWAAIPRSIAKSRSSSLVIRSSSSCLVRSISSSSILASLAMWLDWDSDTWITSKITY